MTLNFQPSGLTNQGTFVPDNLMVGGLPFSTKQVTVKSGASLARGTVLEEVVAGTAASAAKSGGNTGNGTLTLDATTPVLTGAAAGVYQVRLITAATNAGTFRVTAPNGNVLGDVGVGATFSNKIKFATADGSTDFAVGDGFDITVTATGQKVQAVTSDVNARYILAEDVDATGGDKITVAYVTGTFNKNRVTLGSGATLAGVVSHLEARLIHLVDSVQ